MTNQEMRIKLIAEADYYHQKYSQYKNHFDNYILVKFKRDVKTKFGLAFRKDEYAIARDNAATSEYSRYPNVIFRTAYSTLNNCNTAVREDWLEVL